MRKKFQERPKSGGMKEKVAPGRGDVRWDRGGEGRVEAICVPTVLYFTIKKGKKTEGNWRNRPYQKREYARKATREIGGSDSVEGGFKRV